MSINPIWKGANVNNYAAGRGGEQPGVIVIHIAETATLDQLAGWFNNPNAGVTSHYGTGQDGRIYRFVREEDTAFANGVINRPNTSIPWVAGCVKDNPAFGAKNGYGIANARSFSIENCGFTGNPVPAAQWQALVELIADICNRWYIPVDNQHIIRHADLDSVNRAMCPGTGFDMTKLIKDVQAAMPQPEPPLTLNGFNIVGGFKARFLEFGGYIEPSNPTLGGVILFGYPLGNEFVGSDGNTYQAFERYVFCYQPNAPLEWRLTGALVGANWKLP